MRVLDPRKGYLVACNNKFATDNYVHHLSVTAFTTARAKRADQLIKEKIMKREKMNVEFFKDMQLDTKDSYVEFVLESIIKLYEKHSR